jgi:hypothetical protein
VKGLNIMKARIIYLLITLLFVTESAHAYLDPGTGSILVQSLIAVVAGAAVVLKLYWQKVKAFLFGRSEKGGSPADDGPEEDDSR